MSTWNENQHDRDRIGKFTEMPGSAPEGSLGAQPNPWGDQEQPTPIAVREARYDAALHAYWGAQEAVTTLSAQVVASRVREHHPDAVGVTLAESDQTYDQVSYYLDGLVLADGSLTHDISDELEVDVATAVSDIRATDGATWLHRDDIATTASFSIDEALALETPQVGRYVVDDTQTLADTAVNRAEHVMRSGWVDLPDDPTSNPDDAQTAVRDAMTDLVHLAERYGFDAEAILGEARDIARTERIDQH